MAEGTGVLVAPSILSADFGCLADAVRAIEKGGGDWVHVDIMDGSFVPNITFGPAVVAALRRHTRLPFDVHLMIVRPQDFLEEFARAGADHITIHCEAVVHLHRTLTAIRTLGKKAGISIVPSTPAAQLSEVLHMVDIVLVMTVNPGFGGQELIERTLEKVRYLKEQKRKHGYPYLIEVDGGINRDTCRKAVQAGAEVLVAGSAVFNSEHPEEEIRLLRCRE
jgi:ribulose-phosphate 3-epimerase